MPGLTGRRDATRRARDGFTVTILVMTLLVLAACGTSSTPTGPTPTPGDVAWKVYGTGSINAQSILPLDIAAHDGTVVVVGSGQGYSTDGGTEPGLPIWASVDGGLWKPVTTDGSTSGSPLSVTAYDGGFAAVGIDGCTPTFYQVSLQDCSPAIWRSADGLAWNRVTLNTQKNAQLTAVTTWKDGLLAVGGRLVAAGTNIVPSSFVLHSADGTTWEQLNTNSGLDSALTDVAATDDTLIAVGPGSTGTGPLHATAWSSTDGTTWTRETIPGGGTASQWVSVSVMPGGFGAVDVRPNNQAAFTSSVWQRDTAWHPISVSDAVGNAHLMAIASGPYGAIVLAMDGAYRPTLYATQDGFAWGPVAPTGELPNEAFVFTAATWADGRFFATGINMATYSPTILAGMAYVPRPGEIAYVTPVPTPSPTPGPTPAPPPQNALGVATVSWKGVDGFAATKDGPAQCTSGYGAQGLSQIVLYAAGTVAGAPMRGNLSFQSGSPKNSAVQVNLTAFPMDNGGEEARNWNLQGTVTTIEPDGLSGTVSLANGGGSVTWICESWISEASQTATSGRVGELTLQTNAAGWTPAAQGISCMREWDGQVGEVGGFIGSFQGGSPISVDLPLHGRSVPGEKVVADLYSDATPNVRPRALVTFTKLGAGDATGVATLSLHFAAPVEGWPQSLKGTLTWRCPGRTDTDANPMAACTIATSPPVGINLAFAADSTVSAELASEPRSQAFDGEWRSAWNSGDYAIQWIEVDLGKPVQVGEVRLAVAQTPIGHTEHHLYGRQTPDGPLVELTACGGETNDQQTLLMTVSSSAKPTRYVRIETVASPSWIAWREIEVYAAQ